MLKNKILNLEFPTWILFVFFLFLILSRIFIPTTFVFDEVHYVPSSKQVWTYNPKFLNAEHPPLGKFIMGSIAKITNPVFTSLNMPEVTGYRFACTLFAIFTLMIIARFLRYVKYDQRSINACILLIGFNIMWFVQAKTAMLEPFYVFFALTGCFLIYENSAKKLGWICLAAALATKWSSIPYIIAILLLQFKRKDFLNTFKGLLVLVLAYYLLFNFALLPLHQTKFGFNFISHHIYMNSQLNQINGAAHPYASHAWQWPLLTRPMWYHYEATGEVARCVMSLLNPPIALFGLIFTILMTFKALKQKSQFRFLISMLFWCPYLFWVLIPRKSQFFYYYYAPSLMFGIVLIWFENEYLQKSKKLTPFLKQSIMPIFVLICATLFVYFLPILDGRIVLKYDFMKYMWFRSWI